MGEDIYRVILWERIVGIRNQGFQYIWIDCRRKSRGLRIEFEND